MRDAATAEDVITGADGRHWHALGDGRIQCDVCPRFCKLRNGQRGLCFVRANSGGRMVLTTYGRSSGFCVDPIEKKPLNQFLPGTPVLSFGTAGCNLTCKFCQNWDISKSREVDTLADAAAPETLAEAALRLGCRSVAYTYNDPTIFLEYAIDVAKACNAVDVKSVAVTAGYIAPEAREEFYTYMDAANVDLKAFTEDFYHKLCTGELARVLDTLIYLRNKTDVWFEVTTLLIPGENDSPEEIDNMTRWFLDSLGTDVPLHFTAFHPDYRMRNKLRTPHEALLRARDIALRNGLHHVYVGNVHDEACSSTYCPCCGDKVIGRDWYRLTRWNLDDKGRCRSCSMAISGVYDGPPGDWGRKRKPVRLIEYDQHRRSSSNDRIRPLARIGLLRGPTVAPDRRVPIRRNPSRLCSLIEASFAESPMIAAIWR